MKYKYMSGIEVMEGDVIMSQYGGGPAEGVVLHVLLPNSPEAEAWGVPEGGVMIEGGGLGLFLTAPEDEEDIVFVRRAGRRVSTMKYMSGLEVMEGDVIVDHYGDGPIEGVVLKVILPNTPDAEAWASPNGGVLIEGGGLGLAVHKSLEDAEDLVFVRRANDKP